MSTGPAFRSTLVQELSSLVNSREVDERSVRMEYVEDKWDVLSEFIDYYTDDLLKYDPFAKEFSQSEIEELQNLIRIFQDFKKGDAKWSDIRSPATHLLKHLQHGQEVK